MAVTLVGAGDQVSGDADEGSITPVIPSGDVANDFALLIIAGRPSSDTDVTAPSGWALISGGESYKTVASGDDIKLQVMSKVLAGGDSNPSVTIPATWEGSGMSAQIAVWRGVDLATSFDASPVASNATPATSFQPTGITTVTTDALVVCMVGAPGNTGLEMSTPLSFTELMGGLDYVATTSPGGIHQMGLSTLTQASPGAVTMPTWATLTGGNPAWVGLIMALRPSVAVGHPAAKRMGGVRFAHSLGQGRW